MRKLFFVFVTLACCFFMPASGYATMVIFGQDGLEGLGSFEGSLSYSASSATAATLTVVLTNTSPAANGGYLDAFVFNNPGNYISGVSLLSGSASGFSVFGGPGYSNGIPGVPFGQFDIGATTGNAFLGGGAPSGGMLPGVTGTFYFSLTGSGLNGLNEQSFMDALSSGTGAGEGYQPFVVRFRGFEDGGSDKVPDDSHLVPEPATASLLGLGLIGLLRKTKKMRQERG